jgi:pyridoxine 5-phosphate synthase
MTSLSININKIALIRNSRGSDYPNLVKIAQELEQFGAQGITIHPRPDERHSKFSDIAQLKSVLKTELNVEGRPQQRFMDEVLKNRPAQCTLVPDADHALTSDSGWDTIKYQSFLSDIIKTLQAENIRVSIFVNPISEMVEGAKKTGADRIELYTGEYAKYFQANKNIAIADFVKAAEVAQRLNLGLNAGHDLNLQNLSFFKQLIPNLLEVSIGHAFVVDSLYYGFNNTTQMYLQQLQ